VGGEGLGGPSGARTVFCEIDWTELGWEARFELLNPAWLRELIRTAQMDRAGLPNNILLVELG
jgi:hypothetical protein